MSADDADLDALVARTWNSNVPISASEVARALEPWDASVLVEDAAIASEAGPEAETAGEARGVLSRLRGLSSARPVSQAAQEAAAIAGEAASAEGLANTATVSFPAAPSNLCPIAARPIARLDASGNHLLHHIVLCKPACVEQRTPALVEECAGRYA